MIILRYHEVFFRLAGPTAMPAHLGAYSLEKTSWYRNIIILFGVEEHPIYCLYQYVVPQNWCQKCHYTSKEENDLFVYIISYVLPDAESVGISTN